MGRKQKLIYALGGFILGAALTCGVWLWAGRADSNSASSPEDCPPKVSAAAPGGSSEETSAPVESGAQDSVSPAPTEGPSGAWDSAAVYTGGDTVSYGGRRYRAKW